MENSSERSIPRDLASMSKEDRLKFGKELGERKIIDALKRHGVEIIHSSENQDTNQNIDGFWEGRTVQLKLRSKAKRGRTDLTFELLRDFYFDKPVHRQVNNKQQLGRDLKESVDFYFLLSEDETRIFELDGIKVSRLVRRIVEELQYIDHEWTDPYLSDEGVEFIATQDRDTRSGRQSKLMAFIPISLVLNKEYLV